MVSSFVFPFCRRLRFVVIGSDDLMVGEFTRGLPPDLVDESLEGLIVVDIHSLQGEEQFLAHGTPKCSLRPARDLMRRRLFPQSPIA